MANPFAPQMKPSLLEHMGLRGHPISFLSEQRRSVAGLMDLVSDTFYDSRLTNGPGTALSLRRHARAATTFLIPYFPKLDCPLVLWQVNGTCRRDASSPSWYNVEEATAVVKLVQRYLASVPNAHPSLITIITPYRRQNDLIRQKLSETRIQGRLLSLPLRI